MNIREENFICLLPDIHWAESWCCKEITQCQNCNRKCCGACAYSHVKKCKINRMPVDWRNHPVSKDLFGAGMEID